jgi:hypothetical protein
MAEPGSWSSICRHGLLSTSALLDMFQIEIQQRVAYESRRRPEAVELEHPRHGRVVLRDQKPLSEAKLARCLEDGLSVADWLRRLNAHVFFWVDPARLLRLREARAYRGKRQLVLTIDTASLLARCHHETYLTNRNTGATSPFAHPRGAGTFVPLEQCPCSRRVVELAIQHRVGDIKQHVVSAVELGGGKADEVLFESQ